MKCKRLTALICAAAILLSGCSVQLPGEKALTYTDTLFDTVISVRILDPAEQDVLDGCEQLCRRYDTLFSKTDENSDIYKINNAKGKAVEVSDDTIKLLKTGLYYCDLSNGMFDITIGPVSKLWDFKAEEPSVPSSKSISKAIRYVDYKNVIIDGNTVKLDNRKASLDVGAIAKGYIADRIKEYLKDNGVKHAVIDLGGNVLTIGTKTDGSKYNIGIQRPFAETGTPITSVKIEDQSVVTTGVYERYFEIKGKKYHHILSTSSGRPCKNSLYRQDTTQQDTSQQNASQQYTYSGSAPDYGNGTYQQQYQDNYSYNVGNNAGYNGGYPDGMDTTPLSMGEWVLTLLIMAIPCVNIVMCCVWAFGKTGNLNRRNFCRAQLIFMAIGIVLSVIMVIFTLVTGLSMANSYYYY